MPIRRQWSVLTGGSGSFEVCFLLVSSLKAVPCAGYSSYSVSAFRTPSSLTFFVSFFKIRVDPCVQKTPRRREWLPTPVFLPGEFHFPLDLTLTFYVKLFSIIQTLFFIIRTFKIPCSFLFTSELTEPYYIKACK